MPNDPPRVGVYAYGHKATDVFLDPAAGTINFDYFKPYFDQVALPVDLARDCLGRSYSQWQRAQQGCVRFLPLSRLREHPRIPSYRDVCHELVDHTTIAGFRLSGPLSMWNSPVLLRTTPCVFVSHRWQTPDAPDRDGTRLQEILERLNGVAGDDEDVYVWIDYCCLPQRSTTALSAEDQAALASGLAFLPEIVKSCDILILDSSDYMDRVWCYTELFVWLTKLVEIESQLFGERIFGSVVSRRTPATRPRPSGKTDSGQGFVQENVTFRGYPGDPAALEAIYRPIFDYVASAKDSAGYNMGAYEHEYVPELITFMCNAWHLLGQKQCAVATDRELCLKVITKALTFSNRYGS